MEVPVQAGHKVEKGQLLARLAFHDQSLQVEQAKAAVRTVQAQLAEANIGARPQDVEQMKQSLEGARISYEQAEKALERHEILYSHGYIPLMQLEDIQTQKELAWTRYESASAALSVAQEGARQETITMLEAQVEQAQAALKLAENNYNKTYLRAPVSGTIASVHLEVGEMASPSASAVVLVETDTVVLANVCYY